MSSRLFKNLMILAIFLSLVQIVLGTQVRQFIDQQVKSIGYANPELWLQEPGTNFYIHRSFSILVLALNFFLWWRNRKLNLGLDKINYVMIIILLEVGTGIAMYNFDFPFSSQALHLVLASLLFGFQFYLLLESLYAPRKIKKL